MNLRITENYEEMSQEAAELIIKTIKENPEGLYCFAGGDTPVRTLELLIEAHKQQRIDLNKAYYIELDEWIGIDQRNMGSCLSYLNRNFFEPVKINSSRIHSFESQSADLDRECQKANDYIELHGGLTLTLLGVGVNGHLGFNEPGVNPNNLTHIINLDNTTKTVGKKYFDKEENLSQGITLGLKQLMASKVIVVEANGEKKRDAIAQVMLEKVDMMCPVTIINEHHNTYLVIDKEAYKGES